MPVNFVPATPILHMRSEFLKNGIKNTGKVGRKSAFFFFCLFFLNLAVFSVFSFTKREVKAEESASLNLQKIASFSTWFNPNDIGRCENIALASSLIDGVTVQPYGEFSFNQTVGKRSEKLGFKEAKIILNGEFVKGVGGGVCQVSTTLYNACMLSGLTVVEYHAHSLAVGYVPPSKDAMVSVNHDLKLFNPFDFSVKIEMKKSKTGVTATVFGVGGRSEIEYRLTSVILEEILPLPPLECADGTRGARAPKNGVKSEAYLEGYKNGALVSKKRVRTDSYAPVREIIVKKVEDTTKKMP